MSVYFICFSVFIKYSCEVENEYAQEFVFSNAVSATADDDESDESDDDDDDEFNES